MILYEAVVGSRCYGTAIEGSDVDKVYVVLDSPGAVLAVGSEVAERGQHVQDDQDRNVYSLRRFAALLVKGNPNILTALQATEFSGPQATALRSLVPHIVCQRTVDAFVGMTRAQVKRLRSGSLATQSRKHLVDEFGYDTKFLYHAHRVTWELMELVQTGTITYPLREAAFLLDVRNGVFDVEALPRALDVIEASLALCQAQAQLRLMKEPDVGAINRKILGIYEETWGIPVGTLTEWCKVHGNVAFKGGS